MHFGVAWPFGGLELPYRLGQGLFDLGNIFLLVQVGIVEFPVSFTPLDVVKVKLELHFSVV